MQVSGKQYTSALAAAAPAIFEAIALTTDGRFQLYPHSDEDTPKTLAVLEQVCGVRVGLVVFEGGASHYTIIAPEGAPCNARCQWIVVPVARDGTTGHYHALRAAAPVLQASWQGTGKSILDVHDKHPTMAPALQKWVSSYI